MARSKQTSQKTEKEKKKKKRREEKEEKKAVRKANSNKGKSYESMIAYVDHNGQLTSTPPDPNKKVEVKLEDIQLGARKDDLIDYDIPQAGRVTHYNTQRGYGFIKGAITQEKIFFHFNRVMGEVKEGDNVTFKIEKGPKGLTAVDVSKVEGVA
jgi:cold shock CspA family protein